MPKQKKITASEFLRLFGRRPEQDDLERINCPNAGQTRHWHCGVCPECNKPRWECKHRLDIGKVDD